ncbi:MAG: ABC transporter substrate-binding protein [Nitrososphaerota archaeon]|nr:ABC transporter substrate-binding protein [Nitrososphaerota archaeon]MDG6940241.1 ABC transporter substrate-binding protein [Nitrososphaerota archaeon]
MRRVFNEILGRELALPDRPERMVSLSPSVTETLFMLGLGDRVVGVSAFCARPEEARAKRKLGSYGAANADVLAELKPDVVFTITGYQKPLALRLAERLPVYLLELPATVAGIADMVSRVGLVAGEAEGGRDLSASLLKELGGLTRPPGGRRPRTYVEIDLGGPVSFGAYSYITDALHLLGAAGVYGHVDAEWLQPDLPGVKAGDPDVFIYEAKMYSKFGREDLERLIDGRGWRDMKAVRTGNYFLTPGPLDFLAHHGPSFVRTAMPWLRDRLAASGEDLLSGRRLHTRT